MTAKAVRLGESSRRRPEGARRLIQVEVQLQEARRRGAQRRLAERLLVEWTQERVATKAPAERP